MKFNQKGFSAVLLLLVIVVVGLIGAVGWVVYDRQKNITDNGEPSPQTSQQEQTQATTKDEVDITKDAYIVTTELYSLKIPDGWTLSGDELGLWAGCLEDASCVTYKEGQKAIVNPTQGGRGGPFRFQLVTDSRDFETLFGSGYTNEGAFKASNVTGVKYYKKVVNDEPMEPSAGSKIYGYSFKGDKYINLYYAVFPGDKDQHTTVEKYLETLQIL